MNTDAAHLDPRNNSPSDEFVQLFTRSQRRLYLFILSQIPNPIEAEEVLQETNVVIWKKSRQFRPGTSFSAWACQIARFEVLKYRDTRRRGRLQFSQEFVELLAERAAQDTELLDRRRVALVECLRKLRPRDRELIQMRYTPGENGLSVAGRLGRPVNSIYQSLGRIRKALFECINRQLTAEAV